MVHKLFLPALLLLAASAQAQEPKAVAKITVSENGSLIVLDASGSVGDSFSWLILPTATKGFYVDSGGKTAVLAKAPGIKCSVILGVSGGGSLALAGQDFDFEPIPPIPPNPPAPNPVPNPPVPPDPSPVPSGVRNVLIFRESADDTPAQARLFTSLQAGKAHEYLTTKGHRAYVLDVDSENASGRPAEIIELWKQEITGIQLPVLVITDAATRRTLWKGTLPATAADVLALVTAHGG